MAFLDHPVGGSTEPSLESPCKAGVNKVLPCFDIIFVVCDFDDSFGNHRGGVIIKLLFFFSLLMLFSV
jgi:hypothetical protein